MGKGIFIKNNNEWKKVKNAWINIKGVWKKTFINKKINDNWIEFIDENWSLLYNTSEYQHKVYMTVDNDDNLYLMNYNGKFFLKKITNGKEVISANSSYICTNFITYQEGNLYFPTSGKILKSSTDFKKIENYLEIGGEQYPDLFYISKKNNIIVIKIYTKLFIHSLNKDFLYSIDNIPLGTEVVEDKYIYGAWHDEYSKSSGVYKLDIVEKKYLFSPVEDEESKYLSYGRGDFVTRMVNNDGVYVLYWEYKNKISSYYIIKISKDTGKELCRYKFDSEIDTYTSVVSDLQNNIYIYHKDKLIKFNSNLEKISELDIGLQTKYNKNITLIYKNGYIYYSGSNSNKAMWKIGRIYVG